MLEEIAGIMRRYIPSWYFHPGHLRNRTGRGIVASLSFRHLVHQRLRSPLDMDRNVPHHGLRWFLLRHRTGDLGLFGPNAVPFIPSKLLLCQFCTPMKLAEVFSFRLQPAAASRGLCFLLALSHSRTRKYPHTTTTAAVTAATEMSSSLF